MFRIEIVVKTVFDGRTDGKFNILEQTLNGLSHDMRCRMAERVLPFLGVESQEFNRRAVDDRFPQIRYVSIDFRYQYFLSQAVAQLFRSIVQRNAVGKYFFAAVF